MTDPRDTLTASSPEVNPTLPVSTSSPSASPKAKSGLSRILVTDNRPDMLGLINHALGVRYACNFASGISQAKEILVSDSFHLALCCFEIPSEADLILVEEVINDCPDTAVVLITGEGGPEIAEHTFALGVHGYLVKPFWPGQLLITTKNALRQRELETAERAHSRVLLASAEKRAEQYRDELVLAHQQAIDDLRASRLETVERLAVAIEMHDGETGHHVTRMASVAGLLGQRLGHKPEFVLLLREAAPMHDVGKIATPDHILKKSGPLTRKERQQVELHTTVGHRILADSASDLLRMAATIALTHHERWDGTGYPQGLAGEEIPLEGRITAVADVFDALLSDRSYRSALSTGDAIAVIETERGTHFDPHIVDIFLDYVEEALSSRSKPRPRGPSRIALKGQAPGAIVRRPARRAAGAWRSS